MIIDFNGETINVTEAEWALNFPNLCYRDLDGNDQFYKTWNSDRGFLFPDKPLPATGPVIWSSQTNEWVKI